MGPEPRTVYGAQHRSAEQAELEIVLQSTRFQRAPGLANFLRYICERYFAGESESLKEYNIAVEALGRKADFDQRKDSIVRVEAHRLRKRLEEFYKHEGADRPLRIVIATGQYAPQFLPAEQPPAADPLAVADAGLTEEVPVPASPAPPRPRTSVVETEPLPLPPTAGPGPNRYVLLGMCVAVVLAVIAATYGSRAAATPPVPVVREGELRILAGHTSEPIVDRLGRTWLPDQYFTGGTVAQTPTYQPVFGAPGAQLFRTRREGRFRYDIPVARNRAYELHLLFVESHFGEGNPAGGGGEGSRNFHVALNGRRLLDMFDILGEAGAPNTVEERVFRDVRAGEDGKIHLEFQASADQPLLSGIALVPMEADGTIHPIRITASKTLVTDADGREWLPDHYVSAGHTVSRSPSPITGTPSPQLYGTERYGHFTYTIPVPPGQYRVTMHFVEQWFGPDRPGRGGEGSRLFSVLNNGEALLRDFDVYRAAGGSGRPIMRTFQGVRPNMQGKLVFQFVPSRNNAMVSALEIADDRTAPPAP